MKHKQILFFVLLVTVIFNPIEAKAGSPCEVLSSASTNEVDTVFLSIVDRYLADWPQHKDFKNILSPREQLGMWEETLRNMLVECLKGNEFNAGFIFGQDMAIYKMTLTKMGQKNAKSP